MSTFIGLVVVSLILLGILVEGARRLHNRKVARGDLPRLYL